MIAQQDREAAKFTKYGLAAAEEALTDAKWKPTEEEDLQATVGPESLTVHLWTQPDHL